MPRREPGRPPHHSTNRFFEWHESAPFSPLIVLVVIGVAVAVTMTTRFPAVVFVPILIVAIATATSGRPRPLPDRAAAAPPVEHDWTAASDRMRTLRSEYAAYECDPLEVLRLPALADVTVPSTGRFVDAFAEAQALETDALPPESHAASFVAAVDKAERAWRAAREAAERIRDSHLSADERAMVERVIKLLTTARDSDSGPERLVAYAKARSELARLGRALRLPAPAQAALDAAARGALPA